MYLHVPRKTLILIVRMRKEASVLPGSVLGDPARCGGVMDQAKQEESVVGETRRDRRTQTVFAGLHRFPA